MAVLLNNVFTHTIHFSGARPQESKGTIVRMPVFPSGSTSDLAWSSKVVEVKDKTLKLEVTPDTDCNIGKYEILIETKLKDSDKDFTKADTEQIFYVLFNAWCKGMDKEDINYEVISNDVVFIMPPSLKGWEI